MRKPAILMRMKSLSKDPHGKSLLPTNEFPVTVLEQHYRSHGDIIITWGAAMKNTRIDPTLNFKMWIKIPSMNCWLQGFQLSIPRGIKVTGETLISVLLMNEDFPETQRPLMPYGNIPDYFAVAAAKELTILFGADLVSIGPTQNRNGVILILRPNDQKFNLRAFERDIRTIIKEAQC